MQLYRIEHHDAARDCQDADTKYLVGGWAVEDSRIEPSERYIKTGNRELEYRELRVYGEKH